LLATEWFFVLVSQHQNRNAGPAVDFAIAGGGELWPFRRMTGALTRRVEPETGIEHEVSQCLCALSPDVLR
jgi:hypothetical protein